QRAELDGELGGLEFRLAGQRKGAERFGIGREIGAGQRHDQPYRSHTIGTRIDAESLPCQTSIGWVGAGGATVRRQSIASLNSANCAGVSVIAPSTIGGQTKRPFSSRLAKRHSPVPSQYSAFR